MTPPLNRYNIVLRRIVLRTRPIFLYLGFIVFFSLEDKLWSVEGSCIHLVPFIRRLGSRAGGRPATPGTLEEGFVAAVELGLSYLVVADCIAEERCFAGCITAVCGGEPMVVRGVRLLLEAREEAFIAADELKVVKTDEAVLAWELAEPTPFKISPCKDSVSSIGGCAASDNDESYLAPSRRAGASVLESLSADSDVLVDFSRSRSLALSLAARGAFGKNSL